jgi:hypothetical protein
MPNRRVVLYQDGRGGSWIVDAGINADGGISICSGDGSAEWYAIVDRLAKPMLVEALRKRLNITEPAGPIWTARFSTRPLDLPVERQKTPASLVWRS